ncbi:hypothetical protein Lalb_Chr11g0062651 [Lupinus albus]|uniref:Uncharacterized protein n=1 Tax=Lupinus albus TaxID=3870 RepID=A0A6A4PQR8_LUPAL|nr:hypothetical protein Lalb_Chr11g0062651 [Lupinus albus]
MQAEFCYQQQLVPGMRAGSPPFPNFLFPPVRQGQHDPSSGGSRASGPMQQPQDAVPMLYQQVILYMIYVLSVPRPILLFFMRLIETYFCCLSDC